LILAAAAHAHDFRLSHHREIGSTNDEALSLAQAGDRGRLWIVADAQTKGRGRQGRVWNSPSGNLYASLLLRGLPPLKAPELGFVGGVALINALRDVLGEDPKLKIKWPNDILHDGAKLAGMLLESTQLADGTFACVMGIGVNCISHPQTTPYKATDLAEIGTLLTDRDTVFEKLAKHVSLWLGIWAEGQNFDAVRREWLCHAGGLGSRISIAASGHEQTGIFETIDPQGRLVLRTEHETVQIHAGDVFLAGLTRQASASAGANVRVQ